MANPFYNCCAVSAPQPLFLLCFVLCYNFCLICIILKTKNKKKNAFSKYTWDFETCTYPWNIFNVSCEGYIHFNVLIFIKQCYIVKSVITTFHLSQFPFFLLSVFWNTGETTVEHKSYIHVPLFCTKTQSAEHLWTEYGSLFK